MRPVQALNRGLAAVSTGVREAWRKDVLHYFFSLAAVQGGVFVAQLVAARILGPLEFGYVRVIDTVLAILLTPAGFGMASAIVRYTATVRNETDRRALLSTSLLTVVLASLAVGAAALLILPRTPISVTAVRYLRWMVWLIVLTNAARVIINYFQGRKEIRRVALYNVVFAGVGAAFVAIGAWVAGLQGWGAGRIAAEAILAVGLLFTVRRGLTRHLNWVASRPVLIFGGYVFVSTLLDRVATTADTLYLDGFVGDPFVIGQYGAAVLGMNVALLFPAAVTAVALPYLSERAAEPAASARLAVRVLRYLLLSAAVIALGMVAVGPWIVRIVLGAEYDLAGDLLQWLSMAYLLAVVMSFLGTFLLALGRADLTVVQSVLGVVVNIVANALLIPRFGVWGTVWAALVTYAIRTASLVVIVGIVLRRAGVSVGRQGA